ncbi:hypothetical protein ACJIZ3_006119 [Penstemon smallii]|uniref:Uncharacterized protein n=1 Tax=Penstemon smallii TaxID=265156 RepID=A0ABD3S6X9_9LAMI
MASSDEMPKPMPGGDGSMPPGKPMTMGQHIIDKGAQLIQSLKPIKKMSQHVCTFAIYSHDMMNRQIETHHYATRLNQDFIQSELKDLAQTYGKFWLPLGAPALMMSPQMSMAVKPELIKKRDEKYKISSHELERKRIDIAMAPEATRSALNYADYWMVTGKGFAVDVQPTEMKTRAPFP